MRTKVWTATATDIFAVSSCAEALIKVRIDESLDRQIIGAIARLSATMPYDVESG